MAKDGTPLSNRIKARRLELGLNQPDVSGDASGVKDRTYQDIEAGKREPKAGQIVGIARALGVSTDYLLLGTVPPAPAQTVADMTPAELEALVARASKRDNTINLENARLKKELEAIPQAIRDGWARADAETIALCTYFLTNDSSFLDILPAGLRKEFLTLVRSLGLSKKPSAPP